MQQYSSGRYGQVCIMQACSAEGVQLTDPVHAVEVFHLPHGEVQEREVVSHLDRRLRPRATHARPEPTCPPHEGMETRPYSIMTFVMVL